MEKRLKKSYHMNKKVIRQKVYEKYGGRCAYCGMPIDIKDMQIDHREPKAWGGEDNIENYEPSCRLCNHYKRANNLESFRLWLLGGIVDRLRQNYIFRVAERFGIVKVNGWKYKFFFEGGEPAEEKKESTLKEVIQRRIGVCQKNIEALKKDDAFEAICIQNHYIDAYQNVLKDLENNLKV